MFKIVVGNVSQIFDSLTSFSPCFFCEKLAPFTLTSSFVQKLVYSVASLWLANDFSLRCKIAFFNSSKVDTFFTVKN